MSAIHATRPYSRRRIARRARCLIALGLLVALLVPALPSTASAATAPVPKLLFGIGGEAGPARTYKLVTQAPTRMLSSWYNGPGDLSWITNWKNNVVPQAYRDGLALHLIVFTDTPEVPIATKYGTACGRPYPLSGRFLNDMRTLARTFAGARSGPPLYVTLFTELQTYPCTDNSWSLDARARRYYRALKDRYLETMAVFHSNAPNARVSLGWGGWQARWDQPDIGGGLSLIGHFRNVMAASDFQSFQSMATDSNVGQIRTMTKILGQYGPVMLAHYLPSPAPAPRVASADLHTMMTDDFLRRLKSDGLFAWSFMDERAFGGSSSLYTFALNAVRRYGTGP
jgi:hypothetical protein